MDRVLVNAVEDYRPMGLDRRAAALLLAQSDSPDRARFEDAALMVKICQDAGATDAMWTDDEHEGDMFLEARPMAGLTQLSTLMSAAIQCSGTITGEHGVGRAKRHALEEQLGPEVLVVNRRIKAALDPHNILNPGVML